MPTSRILQFVLLALLLAVVSGCGFHLRDYAALPTALQPIYIGGDAGGGVTAGHLRQLLQSEELDLTPSPSRARYLLLLSNEESERRIVSLDRRGRIAEIGLIVSVQFELVDSAGATVLAPQRVEERRTIVNNPDNVISTSEEESLSAAEMGRTLAANVLRRLSAYRPPEAQQPAGETQADEDTDAEPAAR